MNMNTHEGINTPVAFVARLPTAVEPEDTFEDFSSTPSGLDSYADWVAKGSASGAVIEVPVGAVVLDEGMQIRKRTDPSVVQKYAEGIESGSPFPPVTLACIEGVLVLVDGWHRFMARQTLGQQRVVAFVSVMSYEEARQASALANLANGVPLRPSEILDAFHTFMDTYGYREGHKWLSYREIARKFGKHHTTIRNWMKKHYPRLFKRYQQDEAKGTYKADWDGLPGMPGKRPSASDSLAREVVKQAQVAMQNTVNLGENLTPDTRGMLIETLRDTLQELEKHPYFLSDF